jgi:hypothetical protein
MRKVARVRLTNGKEVNAYIRLVLGALGPALLYALLRPAGSSIALPAAILLLLLPAWAHGVVTGLGTLPALWLLTLVCYGRQLASAWARSRLGWSVLGGAWFGLAIAQSLSSVWLLVVLIVHYSLGHCRRAWGGLRRGWLELPAALLAGAPVAVLVVLLAHPRVWRGGGLELARWGLSYLSVSMPATMYAGELVYAPPVPVGLLAVQWLAVLPASVLILALSSPLSRSWLRGLPDGGRAARALLALCGLVAILSVALCLSAPALLSPFPPRIIVALPFVAGLAAFGARFCLWSGAPRLWRLSAGLLLSLSLGAASLQPSTVSAYFSPLVGGTRGVVDTRRIRASDASELAELARRVLDCDNQRLVHSPDLPQAWWDRLGSVTGARCRVRTVTDPGRAELSLLRGQHADLPPPDARVLRGRVVLWELRGAHGR